MDRVEGAGTPEAQRIHLLAAPAEDGRVIGDREDGLARHPFVTRRSVPAFAQRHGAAEADLVVGFAPLEFPGIAEGEPVLRRLDLPAVRHGLAEKPEIVADAVTERRDADSGHALHEAGRETAEAAVAERGVGLELGDRIEIDAELAQREPHRLG